MDQIVNTTDTEYVNIKTIINSKTDSESRLHAAIFMVRTLNDKLLESKKETNLIREELNSASDMLSNYECCRCDKCHNWFDLSDDDVDFCFCGSDECLYKSCKKCFDGITCEDGDKFCNNCIWDEAHKCETCGKWFSDDYDTNLTFCHDYDCHYVSCNECFNGITCEDGDTFCKNCIEKNADKCQTCGIWISHDNDYDDIENLYFCDNYDCSYKSCKKCFDGIICEEGETFCKNCIEHNAKKCIVCEKWVPIDEGMIKKYNICMDCASKVIDHITT